MPRMPWVPLMTGSFLAEKMFLKGKTVKLDPGYQCWIRKSGKFKVWKSRTAILGNLPSKQQWKWKDSHSALLR